MNRAIKVVLTFAACAILTTPNPASAQTPSAPAAPVVLDRVAAPAPAPVRVPVVTWGGFYGGGSFGPGFSSAEFGFNPLPDEQQFGVLNSTLKPSGSGWAYGFNAGWNFQSGNTVYGIEGDFLWTSIKGDDQVNSVNLYGGGTLPVTLFADQEVDWMSTIRGRYGRLCHNYNIYGTGGIAFGGINSFAESDYTQIAGIFFNASDDSSRTGWTIGGGIEGGFEKLHHLSYGGKMTWRVQYLYANFGTTEAVAPGSTPIPPFEIKNTFSNSTNVIQFGLNYRF